MRVGWSIRAQLFLLMAVLALPLLALIVLNVHRDFAVAYENASNVALEVATSSAAETSRFVRDAQAALIGLSQRPLIRAVDPGRCDTLLKDFAPLYPEFANALTIDHEGNPVCSAVPLMRHGTKSKTAPYDLQELMRTGKFTIGKPTIGYATGKWIVLLAQPLRDDQGKLSGAVALPVDLASFRPRSSDKELPPGTNIGIVTGDGTIVASMRDPAAWVGKDARNIPSVRVILARKHGVAEVRDVDGEERVYGFTPIPGTDWYAYAGIPISAAYADVHMVAVKSVAAAVMIVLLALGFAWFSARALARPVQAMARTEQDIARGNRTARFPVEGPAEIAAVATGFNRVLDKLVEDEHRLRQLSRRLMESEESERRRLARELHDRVGQNVTALNLNLDLMRSELPPEVLPKMKPRLDDCESLLSYTAQLVRDIQVDLRPPGLDQLGLVAALNEHARQVAGRASIKITVSGTELAPRLPPATEIALFRIVQEALNNVFKHAHATEVDIAVEARSDAVVMVNVADNGCGFDPTAHGPRPTPSLGLISMRERAESIGGTLRIESAPGQGTRVIVEAPRAARDAA